MSFHNLHLWKYKEEDINTIKHQPIYKIGICAEIIVPNIYF